MTPLIFIVYMFMHKMCVISISLEDANAFRIHFDEAVKYYRENNNLMCEAQIIKALEFDPTNSDANGFLGSFYLLHGRAEMGLKYLSLAVENGGSNPEMLASYIEALRVNQQYDKAMRVYHEAVSIYPENSHIILNGGLVFLNAGDKATGIDCLLKATNLFNANDREGWLRIIENLNLMQMFSEAETFSMAAAEKYPLDGLVLFHSGLVFHYESKFEQALDLYLRALELRPDIYPLRTNIGAVYQAMGNMVEARKVYQSAYEDQKEDAGYLVSSGPPNLCAYSHHPFSWQNNYGSLLLIVNEKELGVKLLERALEIDPLMENAMVNLGSHFQDEGLLTIADDFFKRASAISPQVRLLEIRMALQLSPVVSSWAQMWQERSRMWTTVHDLILSGRPDDHLLTTLDSSLDRIHFYLVYAGLNDRFIQEEIAEVYRLNIRDLSKTCPGIAQPLWRNDKITGTSETSGHPVSRKGNNSRIRIGFISKFFGVYEPHGMLLEGVMRYLPRTHFEVLALPIAMSDKPLSPIIEDSVDQVVFITLVHMNAFNQLCSLKLDILVFADILSEPMTHFLAHSRVATTQIAFWGNPVTSGSVYIDYFVSADFMEHPFRTRIRKGSDPYTEQVVLLQGQGIWYSSPDSREYKELATKFNIATTRIFTREEFGFQDEWFIFFCPQSLFKIHPLFDSVLVGILEMNPSSHLVVTAGRKERWTETFVTRIQKSLGSNGARFHVISRVSSEKFLQLLKISDVLLHPFPFDGSRTAADGIGMGIPYVTLPTEYLKGRMGASLIRTLNVPELVAKDMSDYIRLATNLCQNKTLFASVKQKLQQSADLIWEDMEYPYEWTRLLMGLSNDLPMNWIDFLTISGRNVTEETRLADIRRVNRESFDKNWAPESWLLGSSGEAVVPGMTEGSSVPRVFSDWNTSPHREEEVLVTHKSANTSFATSAGVDRLSEIQNTALSGS